MLGFRIGDVIAAYLKGSGFVGIGVIRSEAKAALGFRVAERSLSELQLYCRGILDNSDNMELCEYVAAVDWIVSVDRELAKWKAKSGLYTTTHIRASLDGQPKTLQFLEQEFGVSFRQLLGSRVDEPISQNH